MAPLWAGNGIVPIDLSIRVHPSRGSTFPFFRLPAEIRNIIYDLVFVDPLPTRMVNQTFLREFTVRCNIQHHLSCPATQNRSLYTERQAYNEGSKIYWGCNTFQFDIKDFLTFCDSSSKTKTNCKEQMKSVHLTVIEQHVSRGVWECLKTSADVKNMAVQLANISNADIAAEWRGVSGLTDFPLLTQIVNALRGIRSIRVLRAHEFPSTSLPRPGDGLPLRLCEKLEREVHGYLAALEDLQTGLGSARMAFLTNNW
ncbi:MAG: hypothetical protein M1835_008122 [Candelina submexicana]|nr:MAG: hypothetical protein M1835_008122 [Candelina submexicana]